MFTPRQIHFYDYVERPYDKVRALFAGGIIDALEEATSEAVARALHLSDSLHAQVGALDLGAPISIKVESFEQARIGEPFQFCRLRFEWQAAKAPGLFPVMSAEVTAHPVTDGETQLSFFGAYRPPLGILGRGADAMVGQRVAEASVHRFLSELKERLELHIPRRSPEDS